MELKEFESYFAQQITMGKSSLHYMQILPPDVGEQFSRHVMKCWPAEKSLGELLSQLSGNELFDMIFEDRSVPRFGPSDIVAKLKHNKSQALLNKEKQND